MKDVWIESTHVLPLSRAPKILAGMTQFKEDIELIRASLVYDPHTGVLRWNRTAGSRAQVGDIAGWATPGKVRAVKVGHLQRPASYFIWILVHGVAPSGYIEHINGDCHDDRLSNLRLRGLPPPVLTHAILTTLLTYDPQTGLFTHRTTSKIRRTPKDDPELVGCGSIAPNGYVFVLINKKRYRAHRLAWFYVYGVWPAKDLDHINGDRTDNRIANLRETDMHQNAANAKRSAANTSGYKGVHWNSQRGMWHAECKHMYKKYHLGFFTCPKKAHEAYCRKMQELKGEFARFS